jgi:hypothetical protein
MKKLAIACLSLIAAGTLFAAPADNFAAGGWEFGGNAMYTFHPLYAPFSGKTSSEDRQGYYQILDVEANAGFFPVDRLSLSIAPSVYWSKMHSDDYTYSRTLSLALDAGCLYYIPLGGSLVLSAGGTLGLGALPGLPGSYEASEVPDKSLALQFSIEPNAALYFFISDRLAPFAQAGYRMTYGMRVKTESGAEYVPPDGDEFLDHVTAQFRFTLGLKFFLPTGGRFNEAPGRTYPDLLEKGGLDF